MLPRFIHQESKPNNSRKLATVVLRGDSCSLTHPFPQLGAFFIQLCFLPCLSPIPRQGLLSHLKENKVILRFLIWHLDLKFTQSFTQQTLGGLLHAVFLGTGDTDVSRRGHLSSYTWRHYDGRMHGRVSMRHIANLWNENICWLERVVGIGVYVIGKVLHVEGQCYREWVCDPHHSLFNSKDHRIFLHFVLKHHPWSTGSWASVNSGPGNNDVHWSKRNHRVPLDHRNRDHSCHQEQSG